MPADADDWRRMGQERFLPPGTRWVRKHYRVLRPAWDHDHCAFCWAKFVDSTTPEGQAILETDDSAQAEGWTTTAEFSASADHDWVCEGCFADFHEEFRWLV